MPDTALLLSPAELVALTGKKQAPAQQRQLKAIGIDSRTRADGTVVVFRAAIPGVPAVTAPPRAREPDFAAVT